MKHNLAIPCAVVMAVSITCGCMKHKVPPPPPPPPDSILGSGENDTESLFKGDQAILSDQDIARILGTHLTLADRHRLAILNLSKTYSWSEDLTETEAKNLDNVSRALKASPQLTEVRFLPSLLVPEKRTVPYLREAAARVQADLLFVYAARILAFGRDRFLRSDEVHAQCAAESVLLDVRTGIVIHTARASENIVMKKLPGDLNFGETVARAESEARAKAVLSLANAVTAYLAEAAK